jgi:hypothetical protein
MVAGVVGQGMAIYESLRRGVGSPGQLAEPSSNGKTTSTTSTEKSDDVSPAQGDTN